MSRHGGSPESGLVQPVGLMALRPVNEGGAIIEAPETVTAREEAAKRRERALHFERRRLGLEILAGQVPWQGTPDASTVTKMVQVALSLADELLAKTGGVV